MASQGLLRGHAAADRIACRLEHHEEAVSLSAHLAAAASADGIAEMRSLSR
jgi:hypothetical protein